MFTQLIIAATLSAMYESEFVSDGPFTREHWRELASQWISGYMFAMLGYDAGY